MHYPPRALRFATTLGLIAALCGPSAFGATWKGEGELGISMTTGNTNNENIAAKLSFSWEVERWRHALLLQALKTETDDTTTAEWYVAEEKSEFKITERSYAFGVLRYDHDEFSTFEYQTSASVGLGHIFLDRTKHELDLSAGIGARRQKVRDTGETTDDAVLRLQGIYTRDVTNALHFKQAALVETGQENTYFESETAFRIKLNEWLSGKLSYTIKRNSEVTPGNAHTDTFTLVSLVYGF